MASVTVRRRSSQHHLDDRQLLVPDAERGGLLGVKPKKAPAGLYSVMKRGAAVSASLVPFGRAHLAGCCAAPDDAARAGCAWQPRGAGGSGGVMENDRLYRAGPRHGKEGRDAERATPKWHQVPGAEAPSPKDARTPKAKDAPDGRAPLHKPAARRSSQVTVHCDLDFSSLCDKDGGPWSVGDRVTQGRSGVVRKMRSEPPRREAWSIFQQEDPRVRKEKGEGHLFAVTAVTQDWCDACNCQVSRDALRCRNCSYTCHLQCKDLVQLDCNQHDNQSEDGPPPRSPAPLHQDKNETKEVERKPESLSEIAARIEEYNAKATENGMKLNDDGLYTGFIKVHLKLRRPVTVPGGGTGDGPGGGAGGVEKKTSFYLPPDAVKQLHISSSTTVDEVIQGLLKKFMVLDNPRKFALYRKVHRDGQDLFQKLAISEHPLYLRLLAGPDPECLTFVLKENETGEVEWHAFSVPELQNFLVILEKEEEDRVRQVQKKYVEYRERLQEALKMAQGKPG